MPLGTSSDMNGKNVDPIRLTGEVTLKEYLMDTINERDRKYEQRFSSTDKVISDLGQSIKEALNTALLSTKDALEKATVNTNQALTTANDNIRQALGALDKRFEAESLARSQIASQLSDFARKSEIEQMLQSMEKAVVKADMATEKRFDAVNEFRNQLSDQQNTFARRSEVEIEVKALSARIAIAEGLAAQQKGKSEGVSSTGGLFLTISLAAVAILVSVIVAVISRFGLPH